MSVTVPALLDFLAGIGWVLPFWLAALVLAFFVPLFIAWFENCAILNPDERKTSAKWFLNDPGTWFYRFFLLPIGAFAVQGFGRAWANWRANDRWEIAFLIGGLLLAVGPLWTTIRRLVICVTARDASQADLNLRLQVHQPWHDYWWSWRCGCSQRVCAVYQNLFIYPLMYFYAGWTLLRVLYTGWRAAFRDAVPEEVALWAMTFVILTGFGMAFNLWYFVGIFEKLYRANLVKFYCLIYALCACAGLLAISKTDVLPSIKITSLLPVLLSLLAIARNELIGQLVKVVIGWFKRGNGGAKNK